MKEKLKTILLYMSIVIAVIFIGKSIFFFWDKPETGENIFIFLKANWKYVVSGLACFITSAD